MNPHVQKALQHINNANYAGYFEEMNEIDVPEKFQATYENLKGIFIAGQAPFNFHLQLMTFAREIDKSNSNNTNQNTTSMHGIEQEVKGLEKVINLLLERKLFLEEEWGIASGNAKFALTKNIQTTKEEITAYRQQIQILKGNNPNNDALNSLDKRMEKAENDINTMQSDNSVSNTSTITGNGNTVLQDINWGNISISKESKGKQKILFLGANPIETVRLEIDKEYRTIKNKLHRNTHYDFLNPEFALTIDNLITVMNQKPDIVHFAGHGEQEGILLSNESNEPILMPNRAIQKLFKQHHTSLKLVILNSCYSETQAKSISEFNLYVIGIKNKLIDGLAIRFSAGLYIGLSEGKSIEEAYDDAMIVLETEYPNLPNDAYPVVWKDGKKLDI